jgi:uncharacterized protein YbdZ (MbtH family)
MRRRAIRLETRIITVKFTPSLIAIGTFLLPLSAPAQITPGTHLPSPEEQATLELINEARTAPDGLTILRRLVSNDLAAITPSTAYNSADGTAWSANFWTSAIPSVGEIMNLRHVHPGHLLRQFMELVIPQAPLAWNASLGNVAAGYNNLIIANAGAGPGFPHDLAPYQDQNFPGSTKRYTDGGYGPLSDLTDLGENVAADSLESAAYRFASLMIDWGSTADGIQDQTPGVVSHRKNLVSPDFKEIGVSIKPGWESGRKTENQEFGSRLSTKTIVAGVIYQDRTRNGAYTPDANEGYDGAVIAATPAVGGAVYQTTSFPSGGYSLVINTAGTYTVSAAGSFGMMKLGQVTVSTKNAKLDGRIPNNAIPTATNSFSPNYVIYKAVSRQAAITPPNSASPLLPQTLPAGWIPVGAADFNNDFYADLLLFKPATGQTVAWYVKGATLLGAGNGPTVPAGWNVVGVFGFNGATNADLLLFKPATGQTLIWRLNGLTPPASAVAGPTIPSGWSIGGVADFNRDGTADYLLFKPATGQTVVWYLAWEASSASYRLAGAGNGPTVPAGWTLAGAADFNRDGRPDYVLFKPATSATVIWYLDGLAQTGMTIGATLPAGYTLIAP